MLIYNEQRNEYSSDRPETHRVMVEGAEPYVGNAASKMRPPRSVKVIEVAVADLRPYTVDEYESKVSDLVRQRYSESEEFAIQRKAINAAFSPAPLSEEPTVALTEYEEYNTFVESCKVRARELLSHQPVEGGDTGYTGILHDVGIDHGVLD